MGRSSQRKKQNQSPNSRLEDHRKVGSILKPPLNMLPMMNNSSSWRDDHGPEMLWAFLIAVTFKREDYLACFRAVALWAVDNLDGETPQDDMVMFPARVIPDHTRLSELTSEQLRDFLQIILKHPDGASALAPLTLLDGMPNAAIWRTQLTLVNTEGAWETLRKAVIPMLDHQSEISTDIRWLKMITCMRAGKLQFPSSMKTRVHELVMYPTEGDLRSVRPSIRAGEMMLRRHPVSALGTVFWSECFEKTECLDSVVTRLQPKAKCTEFALPP